jgi:hypothetical protein
MICITGVCTALYSVQYYPWASAANGPPGGDGMGRREERLESRQPWQETYTVGGRDRGVMHVCLKKFQHCATDAAFWAVQQQVAIPEWLR